MPYSVEVDGITYGTLSDGSLTTQHAQPLTGSKIIGLDDTKTYKVTDGRILNLTPTTFVSGNLAGRDIVIQLNDKVISLGVLDSRFSGDFQGVWINGASIVHAPNILTIYFGAGTITNTTGRATITLPGYMFNSGKELIVHFGTSN